MKKKSLLLLFCLISVILHSQNTLTLDVGYQIQSTSLGNRDGFAGGAFNGEVRKVIEQPDGKLLVLGSFLTYNGKPAGGIARLLANGELDPTFNHSVGFNSSSISSVYDGLLQSDGKIVVVGSFTGYNLTPVNRGICRINADGTLDQSFANTSDLGTSGVNYSLYSAAKIASITHLSDGNYVVGGTFYSLYNSNNEASSLAIIDGTTGVFVRGITSASAILNSTLIAPEIVSVSVDAADNIYVGGSFHYVANGRDFKYVAKFNSQLVLDQDYMYHAASGIIISPNAAVLKVKVVDTDKLIVFGDFTKVNPTANAENYNITRLNANGLVDPTFATRTQIYQHSGQNTSFVKDFQIDASGNIVALVSSRSGSVVTPVFYVHNANGVTQSTHALPSTGAALNTKLTLLADGKAIIGGNFAQMGTKTVGRICKTGATLGDIDFTFNQGKGFNGTVQAVVRNGSDTYVGGNFISYDGEVRASVLKFDAAGELVTDFLPTITDQATAMIKINNGLLVAYTNGTKPYFAYLNLTTGAQLSSSTEFVNIASGNGGIVKSMVYVGSKLYIGGSFSSIGGKTYFMRANTTTTGLGVNSKTKIETDGSYAAQHYPNFNGVINSMKLLNGNLFIGGHFTYITTNSVSTPFGGVCKIVNISGNGNADDWMKNGGTVGNGFLPYVNDFQDIGSEIIFAGKFSFVKPQGGASSVNVNGLFMVTHNNGSSINTANFQGKLGISDEVYKIKRINDTIILLSLKSTNGYGGNTNSKNMAVINYGGQLNTTITNSIGAQLSDERIMEFSDYNETSKDIFALGSFSTMFGHDRTKMAKILFSLRHPVAVENQDFCNASSPAVMHIAYSQVTGVRYYNVPTGGTYLNVSTPLVDGTTYYLATWTGGQESVYRTPVTVHLVNQFEREDEITNCGSYTWINGVTYNASTVAGSYPSFIYGQSSGGCDSIAYLKLTIKPVVHRTVNDQACGNTYNVAGSSLTFTSTSTNPSSTSIFRDTLIAANGCDSIITYNITFKLPSVNNLTISSCDSYTWPLNNVSYTQSGVYRDTIVNHVGCDSIVTLNLTINTSYNTTVNETACGSFTWNVGNTTRNYTASTQDQITLQSTVTGCDSIINLNLTINQPTAGITQKTANECGSFTIPNSGGITYTNLGTYVDTLFLQNVTGCDSLVRWEVTILPTETRTITLTNCESYLWSLTGTTYTTSGSYVTTVSHQNPSLCDSVITLNLTINATQNTTVNETACGSFTWNVGNTTRHYTTSTQDQITLQSSVTGCDSIITLNLTINSLPLDAISLSNEILTATETGATYQWYNCISNQPIAGETNRTFTVTEDGSYYVEITKNGCTSISNCEVISGLSTKSLTIEEIDIYPNPTSGNITVALPKAYANTTIEVIDVTGKIIDIIHFDNQTNNEINLRGETGIYTLKISTNEGIVVRKITLL